MSNSDCATMASAFGEVRTPLVSSERRSDSVFSGITSFRRYRKGKQSEGGPEHSGRRASDGAYLLNTLHARLAPGPERGSLAFCEGIDLYCPKRRFQLWDCLVEYLLYSRADSERATDVLIDHLTFAFSNFGYLGPIAAPVIYRSSAASRSASTLSINKVVSDGSLGADPARSTPTSPSGDLTPATVPQRCRS